MNLADIGRHWARWQPDDIAIRFGPQTISWRELDDTTSVLAAGLHAQGIRPGDRIALLMLNRPEWIELTIAAWKLAAVIVPLNVRFTAAEVAFVVGDAQCRMLVTEPALAAASAQIDRAVTVLDADALDAVRAIGAPAPAPANATSTTDATVAFLCYTSGTTGDPKGAVLTHESWNVASQGWAQAVQLTNADRVVLPFPLAFTGGLAVFLFTYWAGARLVLEPAVDVDRLILKRELRAQFVDLPSRAAPIR